MGFIQSAAQISTTKSVATPSAKASDPATAAAVRAWPAAIRTQRGVRAIRGGASGSDGPGAASGRAGGSVCRLLSGAAGPRRPERTRANLCRPWKDEAKQGQETPASPSKESGHTANHQPRYLAMLSSPSTGIFANILG